MRKSDYRTGPISLAEMTAAHLMEEELVAFEGETACHDIARSMVNGNFGSVPIVNPTRGLIGMLTEADLLDALSRGKDLKKTPASELMSQPVSIAEEMTAEEIIALFQARHLIRVPVVDSRGRLVGMIARRDLLSGYIESKSGPLPER
jgi:CBS domain-containing protein